MGLITLGIELAIYGGIALYNHFTRGKDPAPERRWIELPQSEEGGSVPLVFGRVRVRKPALVYFPHGAWDGAATNIAAQYVIGIPFHGGTHRFHRCYYGDLWSWDHNVVPDTFIFDGPFPVDTAVFGPSSLSASVEALMLFSGDDAQDLTAINGSDGRNYRGYLFANCVLALYQPSAPDIDFEVSTYPSTFYYPGSGFPGDDANPLDIIAALLCDRYGKHGEDPSEVIDVTSFTAAAATLKTEGLGMSISWEERKTTREMIDDVITHIDAALWYEPDDDRWHIRLIRGDYDYNSLPELTPKNCTITDFVAATADGLPNAVRIEYEDRYAGYQIRSIVAEDQAAAMSADEDRIETVKRFPGCKTSEGARIIGARELAWDSTPGIRCRALAGRQFETARPGDVHKLTYPELQVAGRAMRVAKVSLGLATDNHVVLDLVEDVFSIYRRQVNPHPGTNANPGAPILTMG